MLITQLPDTHFTLTLHSKAHKKKFDDTVVAKEITIEDIQQTILNRLNTAINALVVNFAGFKLYVPMVLPQQFFNGSFNHCTDEYRRSI